jgi:hypothetical protein
MSFPSTPSSSTPLVVSLVASYLRRVPSGSAPPVDRAGLASLLRSEPPHLAAASSSSAHRAQPEAGAAPPGLAQKPLENIIDAMVRQRKVGGGNSAGVCPCTIPQRKVGFERSFLPHCCPQPPSFPATYLLT